MKFPNITNFLMFASFFGKLCPIMLVYIHISQIVHSFYLRVLLLWRKWSQFACEEHMIRMWPYLNTPHLTLTVLRTWQSLNQGKCNNLVRLDIKIWSTCEQRQKRKKKLGLNFVKRMFSNSSWSNHKKNGNCLEVLWNEQVFVSTHM